MLAQEEEEGEEEEEEELQKRLLSSSYLANFFHILGDLMYTTEVGQLFSAFVYRVFIAILLYFTYALINLLIDILFFIFAT